VADDLKQSPIRRFHEQLGARMVPFAGWNMPVVYRSILDEHRAVREKVGIFDISHMGQFFVRGEGAEAWLNGVLSNDLGALAVGQGQYSFLLNENGGVIDDLIVYRQGSDDFFLVVNAAKIGEDLAWMKSLHRGEVELVDESEDWAGMAIQGPESAALWSRLFPDDPLPPRNGVKVLADGGIVCRTGYTGEDGYEYFCPAADGEKAFARFVEAGATACGLGARDTLRLEMCYPLNGNDLSPERTPLEAGLGIFVDLKKGDFCGRERLLAQKEEGVQERLFAIEATGKGAPPRAGYQVLSAVGDPLGELTSGALSPTLGRGICLAYLPRHEVKVGTPLQIDVRGKRFPAVVVKKPFYKPANQQG
jgi:aminomethyltransferase